MQSLRYVIVVVLVFGCCYCRGPPKNRKPVTRPDQNGEAPPVVDHDPTAAPPVKPKVRKPQFFVNGPVPVAPSLGTKQRGIQALSARTAAAFTNTLTRNTVSGRNRLPDNEKSILLHAHNEFRAQTTNPTAANIVQLKWSEELADMAQGWADRCQFAHGNPNNISPFYYVGQNIWAGTGGGWGVYDMVESWHEEVDLYNYRTEACSGVCGHYTQLVWAETTHVGCALQSCSPLQGVGWNSATILICNYGEGGNYIGQKPYISGTPCSRCPAGYTACHQGLCAEPGMETVNPAPPANPGPAEQPAPGGGDTGGGNTGSPGNQPAACGGPLTEKNGEITSPSWPSPYAANQDCEWIINADEGETITIHVTYMDIEPDNQCKFDYILITVRNRAGDAWRGTKYCGNRALDPIIADGSRVKIVFHSDESVHRGGFKATYSKSGGEPEPVAEPCGGTITIKAGTIKSPNYPENYGENLDCKWIFEAPEGKRIRIKFNQFDIEDAETCQYDKITLRLGNEKIPMTLCGNEKPPGFYISVSNRAELQFTTDGRTGNKGFTASYKWV